MKSKNMHVVFFPRDLVATPAAQHTQPTALLCGYFGRLAKKPHRQNNAKDRPKTHSAHCAGCWLHPQTAHAARSARFASPAAHTARSACATRLLANAARRPTRRRLLANSPKTARERTQPVVRSACFIHRGRSSAQRRHRPPRDRPTTRAQKRRRHRPPRNAQRGARLADWQKRRRHRPPRSATTSFYHRQPPPPQTAPQRNYCPTTRAAC